MVMIPTDVGVVVRSQTETAAHPIRPVAEIPSDLPELQQGQVFRARIQEVLPENSYKALVAGQLLTLSLPEGAKAGDALELVVVARTPRTIVAQRVEPGSAGAGDAYQNATISRTGQLIASLLAPEGDAAEPANLTRSGPLMARAPANSADLARNLPPNLSQAVASSGLFYESHQAQWAMGQRSLASLLTEPQGQHSRPETIMLAAQQAVEPASGKAALGARLNAPHGPSAGELLQTLFGAESAIAAPSLAESVATGENPVRLVAIPDDLRPLVQQQLEAVATNRLAWHGEIWPNQHMEWEIQRDGRQAGESPEAPATWQTSMRLKLPRLGEIDVGLQISGSDVRLTLRAPKAASESDLQAALPSLQHSLAAAGLSLAGVQVKNETTR